MLVAHRVSHSPFGLDWPVPVTAPAPSLQTRVYGTMHLASTVDVSKIRALTWFFQEGTCLLGRGVEHCMLPQRVRELAVSSSNGQIEDSVPVVLRSGFHVKSIANFLSTSRVSKLSHRVRTFNPQTGARLSHPDPRPN